jgi:FixJ family two-component response regulator
VTVETRLLLERISPERINRSLSSTSAFRGLGVVLKKDLSKRESEVLRLVAEGKVNRQVAGQLGISVRTVEGHRARIMLKLERASLSDLIRYALRQKIVDV